MSKWVIVLSCVTWKMNDEWPWKSIGHIFYNMSSFVHHFKANSEFKLELQSGNDQFGSKSVFFWPRDLEIWWMTLKNNRVPLIYYIKLCASFQTGVTVRKRSFPAKIDKFLSCVNLKFDGLPWKAIRHLFYATSRFVHHFIAICEFKLEFPSGDAKFGSKSVFFVPCDLEIWQMTLKNNRTPLLIYYKLCASFRSHWEIQTGVTARKRPIWDLWPLTLTSCVDITFVNDNNSWKFHDDTMTETLWKMCDRQTDRQTGRQTDRQADRQKCS